jgi:hypothetical protein
VANDVAQPVHYEDLVGVRSRISWGAILGGTFLALACSLVLTFFFAAVGLSLRDTDVRADAISTGAVVAAVVTILVSLFVGGWATTQLTAGETRREAIIYGVITWAAVTAVSLAMVGMGVRAGYYAMVGGALVAQNTDAAQRNWEQTLRDAGASQSTIDAVRQKTAPVDRDRAERAAVTAAWVGFAGTLLSIGAAIGGALVGCGPTFRLFPGIATRRHEIIIAR